MDPEQGIIKCIIKIKIDNITLCILMAYGEWDVLSENTLKVESLYEEVEDLPI